MSRFESRLGKDHRGGRTIRIPSDWVRDWDRNLGIVLLLLGIGVIAYGFWVNDPEPMWFDTDTMRTYIGVMSGVGVLLVVLGILEIVHGLRKKPGNKPSPAEMDE